MGGIRRENLKENRRVARRVYLNARDLVVDTTCLLINLEHMVRAGLDPDAA